MKAAAKESTDFRIGENLEKKKVDIDWSKVEDLYDDDELLNEIDEADDLVIEEDEKDVEKNKKRKKMPKKILEQVQNDELAKEYARAGGI